MQLTCAFDADMLPLALPSLPCRRPLPPAARRNLAGAPEQVLRPGAGGWVPLRCCFECIVAHRLSHITACSQCIHTDISLQAGASLPRQPRQQVTPPRSPSPTPTGPRP